MTFSFQQLLSGITVEDAQGLSTPVSGIHYDSRQIQPGFIFVCIPGYITDGHAYIGEAVKRGAVALIVSENVASSRGCPSLGESGLAWARVRDTRLALARAGANFYGHPSRDLSLFGITGTNGKTTTTHLISAVLQAKGEPTAAIGTIWNQRTTPESLDLQRMLRECADRGMRAVAMEVSSHGIYLQRVADCEFDAAVFTNLTQDHLDFHRDLSEYLAVKMRLFQGLGAGRSKTRPCYAVVNRDDPSAEAIIGKTGAEVVTYGIQDDADVQARDVRLSERGAGFMVAWRGRNIPFRISLPGKFNVYNSLAAISVGLSEGMEPELVQSAMAGVSGVPGRFQPVDHGQEFAVVVDYAHTPDGLENVLRTARALTSGRVITVFGCGGDRDAGKRPLMGKISGQLSDVSILTSDNPRSEEPLSIIRQIEAGIRELPDVRYEVIPDRREAIGRALQCARVGDFVVIAGKGHETYQIIGDRVLEFDDYQVAYQMLGAQEPGVRSQNEKTGKNN
jgi:UDP-N-acetylmuramoyl-L-alanyl-D-glutamate--2,6-diaminopimelate ligase